MKKVLLTMLGSIVLLGSADGMKRSPSLDGEALRAYNSAEAIKDDDGKDLDSREAAVLRYQTREALNALKENEETDRAAIERLSQGNEKINEEELDKLLKEWKTQVEGTNYQDIVSNVSSYINDEDTGATYLKKAVKALSLKDDATLQDVIGKITAQKSYITREELFSKRDEKVKAEKAAAEKALQEAVAGKSTAEKALQEAVAGKGEAEKALQAVVAEKDEAETEAAAWRLKIKEKNDEIRKLKAELEQAQKAAGAQTQDATKDEGQKTEKNEDVDNDKNASVTLSSENAPKAQEPAASAPKTTKAPAQKPAEQKTRAQRFGH